MKQMKTQEEAKTGGDPDLEILDLLDKALDNPRLNYSSRIDAGLMTLAYCNRWKHTTFAVELRGTCCAKLKELAKAILSSDPHERTTFCEAAAIKALGAVLS